jgi:hydrogenase maturation protease
MKGAQGRKRPSEDRLDPPATVIVDGVELRRRSRVRLRPRGRGDVLQLVLAGKSAVVERIERDGEGNVRIALTVEEDPGSDLGGQRRVHHRLFLSPAEVEPLEGGPAAAPPVTRILVAGLGNVLLGDDGFGVALADRLARRDVPDGVEVIDFGMRGMDLALALQGDLDAVVILDATPRGEPPGTVGVFEPDLDDRDIGLDAHGMDPVRVLALARAMGGPLPRTLIVSCEPGIRLGAHEDDVVAELSQPVRAALRPAERLVRELLEDLIATRESR